MPCPVCGRESAAPVQERFRNAQEHWYHAAIYTPCWRSLPTSGHRTASGDGRAGMNEGTLMKTLEYPSSCAICGEHVRLARSGG